jgi:hypothetical protein
MTEFNLSEKIEQTHFNEPIDMLKAEDVKEFIRLLKEECEEFNLYNGCDFKNIGDIIDKLAGDNLI